jgi:adenosylcobinamide-phosphate synthase
MAFRPDLLLLALMVEAVFGYPKALPHPVEAVGRLIARLDRQWNRGARKKAAGTSLAMILVMGGAGLGFLIEQLVTGWIGAAAIILIATTGLAQRSLHDHVMAVAKPLQVGDLAAARAALAMIVGRDTAPLDEPGIAAAATETLAESFCDGVVAPAFWLFLLGLPGLFAFKAISTADSMIGHLDDCYRDFGWASARADDAMNYIPARIAGVLICLAGRHGWRIMWRDAGKHLSPNAGWPESAMAGALGVRLGGGATYDGEWTARATLGDGERPTPAELTVAIRLYHGACLLMWLGVGALIWLR